MAQSEIAFTTRQMGVPVDGRFRRFDAQLSFDPRQPAAGQLELRVDLASASIGTAETEAELAKAEWFDTRRHPSAVSDPAASSSWRLVVTRWPGRST